MLGQVHVPLLVETTQSKTRGSKTKKAGKMPATEDNVCVCHECGAKQCVPCDRPHHDGENRKQYQERQQQFAKDEQAAQRLITQQCKQCPQCQKNIQNDGGCDSMICTFIIPETTTRAMLTQL